MTTAAGDPIFLDTNILVYASWAPDPRHSHARAVLEAYEAAGTPLFISRQVLREFLATLGRPRTGIRIPTLTNQVRQFEQRYQLIEDSAAVTEMLLTLLDQGLSTQIHDTNIVATMHVAGIRRILTNNPSDFASFADLIDVVAL